MSQPRTVDVAAFIEGRKLTLFNYKVIMVSVLITFLDGFDLLVLSHTASYIADEVGLDRIRLGELFSIGLFGMMLAVFSSAIWVIESVAVPRSSFQPRHSEC